jgi:hypothetical protein
MGEENLHLKGFLSAGYFIIPGLMVDSIFFTPAFQHLLRFFFASQD